MNGLGSIFDNQPSVLKPDQVATLIGARRSTIYDMNYRPRKYKVPKDMFVKNGRSLLIRTVLLKQWFLSRAS